MNAESVYLVKHHICFARLQHVRSWPNTKAVEPVGVLIMNHCQVEMAATVLVLV